MTAESKDLKILPFTGPATHESWTPLRQVEQGDIKAARRAEKRLASRKLIVSRLQENFGTKKILETLGYANQMEEVNGPEKAFELNTTKFPNNVLEGVTIFPVYSEISIPIVREVYDVKDKQMRSQTRFFGVRVEIPNPKAKKERFHITAGFLHGQNADLSEVLTIEDTSNPELTNQIKNRISTTLTSQLPLITP
ncbi:hypothetical protein A3F29_00750 [Candidatus Roizmanbacteria bacterium RIFCSPHIGHO2_12_FULL_33_9]|uniref:Uncharacterized protein n=1 Tax=Candidatus Roizmanbacteria bacterium RIFCSPHIGHO2_12_FULL_33_9 TaxID=1802045 RepID=A0A1F7HFD9_9BACT|nr:MAG: hypothetical protein A3F29_00750 [Candidatus Roizmanbacteria bacterium RIFCSPHIGHO2_12_FULL_33_9]